MKIIGILGGMSAASTQIYYNKLCAMTTARLGGLHSPDLIIRSLDFSDIEELQSQGEWIEAGERLNKEAKNLEACGAEVLVLATNTMHKLSDSMMKGVGIPMVHIADATAEAIVKSGLKSPGLMATKFTMEHSFYTDRLAASGLNPILPGVANRQIIHDIIYNELCLNIKTDSSERIFKEIARNLVEEGADSLILGCTEVCILLDQDNVDVPVFDTTSIHCESALNIALLDKDDE